MMWIIIGLLICFCAAFLGAFLATLKHLLDERETMERIITEIENSLEVLDKSYARIGRVLETPVGSDDPFVKAVIAEIKASQNAVLAVANKLSVGWVNERDDENEGQ